MLSLIYLLILTVAAQNDPLLDSSQDTPETTTVRLPTSLHRLHDAQPPHLPLSSHPLVSGDSIESSLDSESDTKPLSRKSSEEPEAAGAASARGLNTPLDVEEYSDIPSVAPDAIAHVAASEKPAEKSEIPTTAEERTISDAAVAAETPNTPDDDSPPQKDLAPIGEETKAEPTAFDIDRPMQLERTTSAPAFGTPKYEPEKNIKRAASALGRTTFLDAEEHDENPDVSDAAANPTTAEIPSSSDTEPNTPDDDPLSQLNSAPFGGKRKAELAASNKERRRKLATIASIGVGATLAGAGVAYGLNKYMKKESKKLSQGVIGTPVQGAPNATNGTTPGNGTDTPSSPVSNLPDSKNISLPNVSSLPIPGQTGL